jgi:hypothetical protein
MHSTGNNHAFAFMGLVYGGICWRLLYLHLRMEFQPLTQFAPNRRERTWAQVLVFRTIKQLARYLAAGQKVSRSGLEAKTVTVMGKQLGATGTFEQTYTITSMTFNAATCLGTLTLNDGEVYVYSSANSGNTITYTYYANDNVLAV